MLVHICAADDWRLAQDRGEHRPLLERRSSTFTPSRYICRRNRLYAGRTDLCS
jgi:hypothetical protein